MSNRAKKGSVSVVVMAGRLKIRLPRSWFGGEQHYLSLELPDTEANQKYADRLAADIALDYIKGEFDWDLKKYRSPSAVPAAIIADLTLAQIWEKYCEYKAYRWKELTRIYWSSTIGRHIDRCPHQSIEDALKIRDWLLATTTPNVSRRTIAALATAISWGRKHGLVSVENRFIDMADDIIVEKSDPTPNAFSPEEQAEIIQAFKEDRHYSHYKDLVTFWFLTGCRPSEGIGLEWIQIASDLKSIRFDRSRIIHTSGNEICNNRSKTNRSRVFPVNAELSGLLEKLQRWKNPNTSLVFPSPTGKTIDYWNFSSRGWDRIVDPIAGRPSTPYSCRDTWITRQLSHKIPIEWVAKWADNSPEIIRSRYLDLSAIDNIYPV
jgi:integrase